MLAMRGYQDITYKIFNEPVSITFLLAASLGISDFQQNAQIAEKNNASQRLHPSRRLLVANDKK